MFILCHGHSSSFPGNNKNSEGRQIDLKSWQWFGATVQSSGEDGVIVVSTMCVFKCLNSQTIRFFKLGYKAVINAKDKPRT
jgi:hypothetical protein